MQCICDSVIWLSTNELDLFPRWFHRKVDLPWREDSIFGWLLLRHPLKSWHLRLNQWCESVSNPLSLPLSLISLDSSRISSKLKSYYIFIQKEGIFPIRCRCSFSNSCIIICFLPSSRPFFITFFSQINSQNFALFFFLIRVFVSLKFLRPWN